MNRTFFSRTFSSAGQRFVVCAFWLFVSHFTAPSLQAQTGLALLKVEPGATVNALGGAAVALRNESAALAANPALAGLGAQPAASFGYNSYWSAITIGNMQVSPRVSSVFSGIISVQYAGVSDIEKRTAPTTEPLATFGLNDFNFRLGTAARISEKLSIGIAAGFVFEKVDQWRGSAASLDFGAAYQATDYLTLAAAVTQLGPSFELSAPGQNSSREVKQPTAVRVGGSYQKEKLLGSGELELRDGTTIGKVGIGYDLVPEFGLRGGFRFGDDSRTFSAGMTAKHDQFELSYAVVPYSNSLGTAHLLSFGIRW